MLISKTVIIKWHNKTKKWYENKGYIYTHNGDEFEVKVEDLQDGSHALVDVQCDECGEILKGKKWQSYKRHVKEDGKYYCSPCASRLYGGEITRKIKLSKSKSFKQWCYLNLSKELAIWTLSRWDYELNIDKDGNVILPDDVSYGSDKGYWFKCLDRPEHGSELKSIHSFTNGREKSINCIKCNSISITHPLAVKYLANPEDALKYSHSSMVEVITKCPECGHEKSMDINRLINKGFSCSVCSSGYYPEKFVFNMLKQLNTNFQTQLSKKTFKWCDKYKYDNYINKINCIIETHGIQHYEDSTGNWMKLCEVQKNDRNKEELAKNNDIENYIVIDCRKSDMEWIKKSIMNSELPKLLDFKDDDVNWLECHEYGCKSSVKLVCIEWHGEVNNILNIENKLKISRSAVINYLKQGTKLGWCIPPYNPKQEQEKRIELMKKKISKKVICLTTKEIFNSISEATIKNNLRNSSGISQCCLNKRKSSGKHLETNEPLRWMYHDEYLETQNQELLPLQ